MKTRTRVRVYVDFNSLDEVGNININTNVSGQESLQSVLTDGLSVILYDETLEVNAVAKWNQDVGMWVGVPDWSSKCHIE
jgi:hypothetical protein